MITPQSDAFLVQRMAEQSLEDAQLLEVMLEAGCTLREAEACFQGEVN